MYMNLNAEVYQEPKTPEPVVIKPGYGEDSARAEICSLRGVEIAYYWEEDATAPSAEDQLRVFTKVLPFAHYLYKLMLHLKRPVIDTRQETQACVIRVMSTALTGYARMHALPAGSKHEFFFEVSGVGK